MIEALGLDGFTPSGLLSFLMAAKASDVAESADQWEEEAQVFAASHRIELDEDKLKDR
ncbi:hypothetical protein [Komagataeibacter oboediens]|nr:hypothetical protein [Komagataeibacter oboediens]MCK9821814.1 hypothetical protein [Komagataeibacter oboediens]